MRWGNCKKNLDDFSLVCLCQSCTEVLDLHPEDDHCNLCFFTQNDTLKRRKTSPKMTYPYFQLFTTKLASPKFPLTSHLPQWLCWCPESVFSLLFEAFHQKGLLLSFPGTATITPGNKSNCIVQPPIKSPSPAEWPGGAAETNVIQINWQNY